MRRRRRSRRCLEIQVVLYFRKIHTFVFGLGTWNCEKINNYDEMVPIFFVLTAAAAAVGFLVGI